MIKPINVNIVFGLSNCLVTSSPSISYALTSSLLELDELDSPASDELDPPAPVSYTHLDVYKRQP